MLKEEKQNGKVTPFIIVGMCDGHVGVQVSDEAVNHKHKIICALADAIKMISAGEETRRGN